MDIAWRMIGDLVSNLTSVITGLLGLGVVGALLFGDFLGLDVVGNITALVDKIIQSQMNEGQFDHASITLKEIGQIKKVFIKKLLNIHHLRIEYPTL